MSDNTSIISRNRLGNIIDLMENTINPIITGEHTEPTVQPVAPNDTEDDSTHADLDTSELPSSTFFHYPSQTDTDHRDTDNTGDNTNRYTDNTGDNRGDNSMRDVDMDKIRTKSTIRRIRKSTVSNNTWTISDSGGHPILIEWDEKFNNLFFKILEEMLVGNVQRLHPNWNTYPSNGNQRHIHQNTTLPFKTIWFN